MSTSPVSPNFNDATPAAPSGYRNTKWQADSANPANISTYAEMIGGVDGRTTTTETVSLASQGKLVTFSNGSAIAVTLTSGGTPNTFACAVMDVGAGTATLTPSSGQINNGANLPLATNQSGWLFFDGTNWWLTTASLGTTINFADAETPSGTINGTNASFTLAHTPNPAASLILVSDGTTLAGGGVGFTLTTNSLSLVSAPVGSLQAWYRY